MVNIILYNDKKNVIYKTTINDEQHIIFSKRYRSLSGASFVIKLLKEFLNLDISDYPHQCLEMDGRSANTGISCGEIRISIETKRLEDVKHLMRDEKINKLLENG